MDIDLKWDRRFLQAAKMFSSWSKDPSTQVGAVVVDRLGLVRGSGFNGFPRGVDDNADRYANREMKLKLVVHAEVNAIIAAGPYARGATLYVYPAFMLPPICNECVKVAIQAGIEEIVGYLPNEEDPRVLRWKDSIELARMMCDEAGIAYRGVPEQE